MQTGRIVRIVGIAVGVLLLVAVVLGWFWSETPASFNVRENARQVSEELGQPVVVGSVTTATLIRVGETLLDKRGGFLSNDIMPPGVWLDNIPSWEYGVLVQIRDLARAMRDTLSRSQSQSEEDDDLAAAESRFNIQHSSWWMPSAESEYRDGLASLRSYMDRLARTDQSEAQFYARADNLRYWLGIVQARLGSLSQRLSASVEQRRLNTDLANEQAAAQSTPGAAEKTVETPWLRIDNVFYEAKGSTWALIHFLKAVEVDFRDTLENKNARVSLRQIIRELEYTQTELFSPVVLNGGGFGILANHSLVMASYVSRANAALIDLRDLLAQG